MHYFSYCLSTIFCQNDGLYAILFQIIKKHLKVACSKSSLLQKCRHLKTLPHPLIQLHSIPGHKTYLKWLRLQYHARRHTITLNRIQLRPIPKVRSPPNMERKNQPREDNIQLSICQVRAGAHPRAGTIPVMLRPGTRFIDAHESLRDEGHGVLEVTGIMVGGPHVHEEGCAGGDGSVLVSNVFDGFARERHVQGAPVPENFFDEGGHVFTFFVCEAGVPGVRVRVGFRDFFECCCLDLLAMGRGKVGDCHVNVAREGIEASGDHS